MPSSRTNSQLIQPAPGPKTTSKFQDCTSRRQFLVQAGQLAAATLLSSCAHARPSLQIGELTENLQIPTLESPNTTTAITIPPLPEAITPSIGGTAIPLKTKIGQMILAGFNGQRLSDSSPIIQDIAQNHVGSVALFGRNIVDAEQLSQLTTALQGVAEVPLLISVDQEGGQVSRVGSRFGLPSTYSAAQLGRLNDLETTQRFAEKTAKTLRSLGINLNLAPVVDLNTNPLNPIIGGLGRSFSHDPHVVTQQALTFIQAHHQEGVLCTLKHFPGHGSSTADSHLGFVDVTETWSADELTPFASIIQSGRCDAVMTAHIFNAKLDSEHPATLSKGVITGILRQRLGYDGVIMTDDIQMGAIRNFYPFDQAIELSLNAGVDIFSISRYSPALVNRIYSTVYQLLDSGRITEERIDRSFRRIIALKTRTGAKLLQITSSTSAQNPQIVAPTDSPTQTPTPVPSPSLTPTVTLVSPTSTPSSNEVDYLEKLDRFLH